MLTNAYEKPIKYEDTQNRVDYVSSCKVSEKILRDSWSTLTDGKRKKQTAKTMLKIARIQLLLGKLHVLMEVCSTSLSFLHLQKLSDFTFFYVRDIISTN